MSRAMVAACCTLERACEKGETRHTSRAKVPKNEARTDHHNPNHITIWRARHGHGHARWHVYKCDASATDSENSTDDSTYTLLPSLPHEPLRATLQVACIPYDPNHWRNPQSSFLLQTPIDHSSRPLPIFDSLFQGVANCRRLD